MGGTSGLPKVLTSSLSTKSQTIRPSIGVILPQAALLMPFSVFMMRTVMQEVPAEMIEASTMDGCTPLYGFLTVVVPLARPGLMSLTLIGFLLSWQE